MDTHKRTVVKTITWRIIAVLTTVLVIYAWTKNWTISLASGLIANAMKTIFYYIHERVWNLTDFERIYKKKKK
jgi:adenylylsulfate kinase